MLQRKVSIFKEIQKEITMLVSSLKENRMLIIEGLNLKTSEKSNSLSKNNLKNCII
jgi:hypothetical protein